MKKVPHYLIAVPFITGLLTLAGWALDIDILKRPYPTAIAMNPMTAIGMILMSISIYSIFNVKSKKGWRLVVVSFALITLSFAFMKLLVIAGIDYGVDRWLFTEKILAENASGHVNRMAPNSALILILLSVAILLSFLLPPKKSRLNFIVLCVFVISAFSFLGYVYRVREHVGVLSYLPMALQTSICFISLSLAFLFYNREFGFMSVISSPYIGGRIARRLIPLTVLIPLIWAYIRLYLFSWRYQFSVELGVSILTTGIIVMLLTVIWFMAKELNKSDIERHEIEAKLEQQAQLFDLLPDAVIYADTNLRFTSINRSAAALLDTDRKQAVGHKLDDFVTVEVLGADSRGDILDALEGHKGIWQGETIFTTPAGVSTNLIAKTRAIKNSVGDTIGMMGIYTDITAVKVMEERLKTAMDGLVAGLWEWNINEPDHSWLSPRYNTMLGYEPDELPPTVDTFKSLLHPDDMVRGMTFFRESTIISVIPEVELRYRTKSGVYKWFAVSAKAKKAKDGSPAFLIGSIVDIDEKKKAQEIIAQQASLIQMMPDGVIYGDMDNKIISLNEGAEEMFEISSDEARGKNIESIVSFTFVGKKRSDSEKEFRATGFLRQEMEITSKSGKKSLVLFTAKRFDNIQGTTSGWICVYTDIGPLRLNEELKAANEYLEQLTYIGSHDTKAPLITIKGLIDMMYKMKVVKEGQTEILDMINNSVMAMQKSNNALNNIIMLKANLSSKKRISGDTLAFGEIINNILATLKSEIESADVSVAVELNDVAHIKFAAVHIQSVFYNLILNAIKYREPTRPLKIQLTARSDKNDAFYFSVEDNGMGLDLERGGRNLFGIFKRFHTHVEGTGVGLHIVKSIVEAYGGSISVKSKLNEGTCFEIVLKSTKLEE